jgi:hypothetical protein
MAFARALLAAATRAATQLAGAPAERRRADASAMPAEAAPRSVPGAEAGGVPAAALDAACTGSLAVARRGASGYSAAPAARNRSKRRAGAEVKRAVLVKCREKAATAVLMGASARGRVRAWSEGGSEWSEGERGARVIRTRVCVSTGRSSVGPLLAAIGVHGSVRCCATYRTHGSASGLGLPPSFFCPTAVQATVLLDCFSPSIGGIRSYTTQHIPKLNFGELSKANTKPIRKKNFKEN